MKTSIRELYRFAAAEGEGVGTAYEYFAKSRVITPLLGALPPTPRVVVAGLPEKYGTSLDFILVAAELRADVLVWDDREAAVDRSRRAIEAVGGSAALGVRKLEYKTGPLEGIAEETRGDLVLSCEALQRVPAGGQTAFVRGLRTVAPRGIIFVPNSRNRAHLELSGLGGFDADGLREVAGDSAEIGFVDMPPFPPGITRSAEQRERAKSGWFEAVAMGGLEVYCRGERFVPTAVKERHAHIVYARWR